jgi:8-oxo-dGTP pyrophosphatase MutT (NUDIX family)
MLNQVISQLYDAFSVPLPGASAHLELAPYRKNVAFDSKINQPKIASTLLLLYPKQKNIYFCLIERPQYEGIHSNQISFPGGKNEEGETIKQTAIRETFEEVGVDPISINVIGEMTQVYVPPSNFLIHPFVGYCDYKPDFRADKREVDNIIEVKLSDLSKKDLIKIKKMNLGRNNNSLYVDVPYMDLNNKIVWGATSVILNEFRKILKL